MSHLTKRARSQKSEKALALKHGGRVQPASGALPVKSLKGDVRLKHFLIDDKTTEAKSFSLKLEDWMKIRNQAYSMQRRHPVIHVNFEQTGTDVYVIGALAFERFLEYLNES